MKTIECFVTLSDGAEIAVIVDVMPGYAATLADIKAVAMQDAIEHGYQPSSVRKIVLGE